VSARNCGSSAQIQYEAGSTVGRNKATADKLGVLRRQQEEVLQECFKLLVLNLRILRMGSDRRNILSSETYFALGSHRQRCMHLARADWTPSTLQASALIRVL
jgi:hypothetical protein